MRALTAIEVEALVSADPARSPVPHQEASDVPHLHAALYSLKVRGCVTHYRQLSEDGKRYSDGFTITDLGRLALRVAVALPSLGAP